MPTFKKDVLSAWEALKIIFNILIVHVTKLENLDKIFKYEQICKQINIVFRVCDVKKIIEYSQ